MKADHDNFHQSAAVSRGASAVKDYQFMLSQKDNIRGTSRQSTRFSSPGTSRASSRQSSPGPSSRNSSGSSVCIPKSTVKSRAKVTNTESRTNHFRMTSSAIKPKTNYKLNDRISDEINALLQHYFYLYSSPPGCKPQNGLDGGRFRKFIMDNKKLLINLKVFKRTEIDVLFTKFKDPSISKLTYEGFLCCIQEIATKYKLTVTELTQKINAAGFCCGPIRDYTHLLPNRFYDDESTYTGVHKAGGLTIIDPNMNAFWGSNGVISPHKLFEKGRREGTSKVKNYKIPKKKVEPWNSNMLYARLFESYCDHNKESMSSSKFMKFCKNVEIIDNDRVKLTDIAKLYNYVVNEDAETNMDDTGKRVMHLPQFYKALDAIAETRDIAVNDLVLGLHDIHLNVKSTRQLQVNKTEVSFLNMDDYVDVKNNSYVNYNENNNVITLQPNDYNLIGNKSDPYEFGAEYIKSVDDLSTGFIKTNIQLTNLENIELNPQSYERQFSTSKFEVQSFSQTPPITENKVDIFNTIYEINNIKPNSVEANNDTGDDDSVEDVEFTSENESKTIIPLQNDLKDPVMSGFLEKKTDKSNIVVWHRRYFVLLRSGILEYYSNEMDRVNNIIGTVIDFRHNNLIVDEAIELKYDKIFIKLNNSASQSLLEYVLHADSPTLASQWVQSMKSVYSSIDTVEKSSVVATLNNIEEISSIIENDESQHESSGFTPLIYGYLQKKSNNDWMGWQKRYVILRTNGEIVYYGAEGDWEKKPPKGMIDLKNGMIEWDKNKFTVTGRSRRAYAFMANDRDTAAKWVSKIQTIIDCNCK